MEIALGGQPVYHCGVQCILSRDPQATALTWIDALERRPYKTPQEKQEALRRMADELDGSQQEDADRVRDIIC